MPSAITVAAVGGVSLTTRRPSTIGVVNANALGGRSLTTNVLCVVADMPWLAKATPTRYNSGADILSGAPLGNELAQRLAKFIYQQGDDRVGGQPLATYLVNTSTVTASQLTLLDGSANDAVTLTSKLYGYDANQINVAVAVNAGDATKRDVTLTFKGQTETHTAVGSGNVAQFSYTGTSADTITVDVRPTAPNDNVLFRINQSRSGLTGAFAPAEGTWLWDGVVTATASADPTPEDGSLLVTGILKTGVADTETITLTDGTATAGTKEWSAITALNYTPSSAAETVTVAGSAIEIGDTAGNSSTFPTLASVCDYLTQYSAQGYVADKLYPALASIPLNRVDQVLAADIDGVTANVTADVWWLAQTLNINSVLVSAVQVADGISQTPALVTTQMAGGTYTAGSSPEVGEALVACRTFDIQTFALMGHTDQASQEELRSHCVYMAGQGAGECNGWVGMPTSSTFDTCKTRGRALNTRHLSLCVQDVEAFSPTGATTQYAPDTLALMLAAMQCSTAVGTPLTRKYPLVNRVITHSSWDADTDAEEALENGLTILTTDRLGLRVERSITTYLTDDNPIFSEMSANESLNTCIRDLRENLDTIIGEPNVEASSARVRALAKARLQFQAAQGIIKDFDADSLAVDDYGDYLRVRFRVAVTEPINWIVVEATAARTPFNA